MTFTVFGTGAIGAYYGAKLATAGNAVHFIIRSDYEAVRDKGLTVLSPEGDMYLENPSVYKTPEEVPKSDIILIAMKTTGNHLLKEQLEKMIGKNTALLILQNGMEMEEEMIRWFPDNPVLGGMCFICSRKKSPGVIEHQDKGSITLGCLRPEDKNLRDKVGEIFNNSKIETSIVDDIHEARWRKLLWNIPYNGLCALLNSNTRELMTNQDSRQLVEDLMLEVLAGAEACGCPIEREAMEKMLYFTEIMTPYEPSMKLDLVAGRPMEIEYMYENPLKRASEAGCEMEKVKMLTCQLRFLDREH